MAGGGRGPAIRFRSRPSLQNPLKAALSTNLILTPIGGAGSSLFISLKTNWSCSLGNRTLAACQYAMARAFLAVALK
jgi:hypothetical protein